MAEIYVSNEDVVAGADPQWAGAGKVHDWRNHVPDSVRQIWPTFSEIQRSVIIAWAEDLAGREDWD